MIFAKLKSYQFIALFIIGTLTFSCKKILDKPTWDTELLAPVIKTTLTLNNLLSDSVIQTNPDSSLKLVYQSDVFNIDVDSIFKIPDTTLVEEYVIPLSSTVAPGGSFYSNNEEKELNVSNGVELNYAKIESGYIDLEIFSDIKEKVIVNLKILSATKNGDTLSIVETIDAATVSQPGYFTLQYDLSEYELDLTGLNHNENNTLVTYAIGTVDPNASSSVNINAGDKIIINYSFVDVVPFYVRGYFGTQNYHYGPDTTLYDAFNRIKGGTLDLEQVDVSLDFENGIGVDAQLIVNQLSSFNSNNAQYASLNHSVIGSPININRAQETHSVPEVNYTYYHNDFTTSNSNIDELLELFPNQLIYEVDLAINPLGNISGNNDFVFKKHPLKTNLNIEMPLSLVANQLTLVDTIDFNLDEENIKNVIEGNLFVYAENGFPFDAVFNLDLLDANQQIFKTLQVNNYIASGLVNASLKVEQPTSSVLSMPLSTSDIQDLTLAKKLQLKIAFTTAAQPNFIKIYSHYKIDIKVVADFVYQVNGN
ncbi:MAG: hypothetical protein H6586_04005 [Flavobacteriales bacterium]|nr:hypothetical protein [Flavobacteriales bacterium]